MAIIPDAQQFHTLSSTVDTTERGSALANASREVYTMQDIKESISAIDGSGVQYAVPVFTDANTLTNLPIGSSGQVLTSTNPQQASKQPSPNISNINEVAISIA